MMPMMAVYNLRPASSHTGPPSRVNWCACADPFLCTDFAGCVFSPPCKTSVVSSATAGAEHDDVDDDDFSPACAVRCYRVFLSKPAQERRGG